MGSMVNINYEIPDDLHRRLKIQAVTQGITLKDWIIQLLSEGSEENGRKENPDA